MGRHQIQIRRLKSEEARQACFSKHRARLFNKARELAMSCGAQIAATVFSPSGEAFSFGNPSFEAVLERYVQTRAATGGGGADTEEENKELADLKALPDAVKARKKRAEAGMAKERVAASTVVACLEADVRNMGEDELMLFSAVLEEVLAAVTANKGLQDNNQVHPSPQQFLANNSARFVDQFGVAIPPPSVFGCFPLGN